MGRSEAVGSAVIRGDLAEITGNSLPWGRLSGSRVLVAGASGMIPSYVVFTLLALNDTLGAGITVLALVRNRQRARRTLAEVMDRPDVVVIEQDVVDRIETDAPIDVVVHGASAARPSLHASDPVATIRANVQGTFNLLDLCVAGGGRFVLMSSSEVYGTPPAGTTLISEDSYGGLDILSPRSCYSEGKRAAESITAAYVAQHHLSATIARFGHIYGPGMSLEDGRVQADFAADVMAGRDIVLNSDGSATRTYTYVADAVAGTFYAMLVGEDLAYNVADSTGLVSIRELAEAFVAVRPEKHLRAVVRQSAGVRSYSPVKRLGLDSARLTGLGWFPRVDLQTGLDRVIRWHEERDSARRADSPGEQ